MFKRNEPCIYIGPAPKRRRKKWLGAILMVALACAITLAPVRPHVSFVSKNACADHVVCTIDNWIGNWVGLGKLFGELRSILQGITNLRNLIAQKWNEFMQYKHKIDYAASLLKDPYEAYRVFIAQLDEQGHPEQLIQGGLRLHKAYHQRGVTDTQAAVRAIVPEETQKKVGVVLRDWYDLAMVASRNPQQSADTILRQASRPLYLFTPVDIRKMTPRRQNEYYQDLHDRTVLYLPPAPRKDELARMLQSPDPEVREEAVLLYSKYTLAWTTALTAEFAAQEDAEHANLVLDYWDRELGRQWMGINKQPYTSAIKTIAHLTIQNQILLARLLREIAQLNAVQQAVHAYQMHKRVKEFLQSADVDLRAGEAK